ncbi:MAG: hypothetical protein IKP81_08760 [Paludibacteraceae bacterium]|nr:hypothetical protein [Paludibacteraceae bacterium]MBR6042586.1 hypothetical protein [Paludibacteraceae bacterium]MBR6105129.1 hypothetical protein [Paludibacteraceae bacterium]
MFPPRLHGLQQLLKALNWVRPILKHTSSLTSLVEIV